jgi:GT2 family glycosyltransferase
MDCVNVSVIVVTYRRNDDLQRCLMSIYTQEGLESPYEVIVIDNDGSAEILPSPSSSIILKIERPGKNLGVTGGRNLGIECAIGEYLIFLDDDAIWHDSNDAARLVSSLVSEPQCGGIAVQVLDPITKGVARHMLPHPNKAYIEQVTEKVEVPYYYGCAHILRASAIKTIGAYPLRFFYAMEEVDLSLRLIDAGYRILYDPNIAVIHYESRDGRPIVGQRYWKNNSLNKCRVAWRLLPLPYPWTILAIWSMATLIKTRRINIVWSIWSALWNERHLLRQERHPIASQTVRRLRRMGARLIY